MNIYTTITEVRQAVADARATGRGPIGFVPTMGALHAGHGRLVETAAARCGFVVVSVFVNPTQFGPGEDFAAYPRTLVEDAARCEAAGAAAIFAPSVAEIYPQPGLAQVHIQALGETLCGASRPGHFTGVCTVVGKLFNIVGPDQAFFGAKDFQQAAIIRRMAADLNFPVEIVVCPTVREPDGLAMSSRNRYLTPPQRAAAPALFRSLQAAATAIRERRPAANDVRAAIQAQLADELPEGDVDYIELVDPHDLRNVQTTDRPVLIALAVRLGKARLIDNIVVD
ncbi:MAG: pantoate--beta-alanine ligase [Phycisphaerae bacterium]|nr:pantoate--beta-alanine ligase [Phycisphaerae bacterium]